MVRYLDSSFRNETCTRGPEVKLHCKAKRKDFHLTTMNRQEATIARTELPPSEKPELPPTTKVCRTSETAGDLAFSDDLAYWLCAPGVLAVNRP